MRILLLLVPLGLYAQTGGAPVTHMTPELALAANPSSTTAGIQEAINALENSGVCKTGVMNPTDCNVYFAGNKNYSVSSGITLNSSFVHLVGEGGQSTLITNSNTSANTLTITGTNTCSSQTSIVGFGLVQGIGLRRTSSILSGTVKGFNIVNVCNWYILDTSSYDSPINYYYNGTANIQTKDSYFAFTATSGSARYGYYSDSANGNGNYSSWWIRDSGSYPAACGNSCAAAVTGFYANGSSVADIYIEDLNLAGMQTGVNINSTCSASSFFCNADVRITNAILDGIQGTALLVTGLNNSGSTTTASQPSLQAIGGLYTCGAGPCIDIEQSTNVNINTVQLGFSGTSAIAVKFAGTGCALNTLTGATIQTGGAGSSMVGVYDACDRTNLTGNTFSGTGVTMATGIQMVGATNNQVHGNQFPSSGVTTPLSADSASTGNNFADNTWAYSAISNSGTGNSFGIKGYNGTPTSGDCTASTIGAVAVNSSGGTLTTLYVCTSAGVWTPK